MKLKILAIFVLMAMSAAIIVQNVNSQEEGSSLIPPTRINVMAYPPANTPEYSTVTVTIGWLNQFGQIIDRPVKSQTYIAQMGYSAFVFEAYNDAYTVLYCATITKEISKITIKLLPFH
jgi:hypothetical protein